MDYQHNAYKPTYYILRFRENPWQVYPVVQKLAGRYNSDNPCLIAYLFVFGDVFDSTIVIVKLVYV